MPFRRSLAALAIATVPVFAGAGVPEAAPALLSDTGPRPVTTARTIVVRPVLGDPAASGALLRSAYAAVADASADFPVVIRMDPGTYDIGVEPLELGKPHVHLEGSGRDATVLRGTGFAVLTMPVLSTVSVRVRELAIANTDGAGLMINGGRLDLSAARVTAVLNTGSAFAQGVRYNFDARGSLKDVEVEASNGSGHAVGVTIFANPSEAFAIEGVRVRATGTGSIRGMDLGSASRLVDVRVESSSIGLSIVMTAAVPPVIDLGGVHVEAGLVGMLSGSNGTATITVRDSTIAGSPMSIDFWNLSAATIRVADSLLSGQVRVEPPNTIVCLGAYDGAFQPRNSACQ
jgi:hypothetical protein